MNLNSGRLVSAHRGSLGAHAPLCCIRTRNHEQLTSWRVLGTGSTACVPARPWYSTIIAIYLLSDRQPALRCSYLYSANVAIASPPSWPSVAGPPTILFYFPCSKPILWNYFRVWKALLAFWIITGFSWVYVYLSIIIISSTVCGVIVFSTFFFIYKISKSLKSQEMYSRTSNI